jgi:transposase-like protein
MMEERFALADLLEQAGDGDFLRAALEVLQLLMESDVERSIGAARYERSGERKTWRNGHRDRTRNTRLGALQLRIPTLRQGTYVPPFLECSAAHWMRGAYWGYLGDYVTVYKDCDAPLSPARKQDYGQDYGA